MAASHSQMEDKRSSLAAAAAASVESDEGQGFDDVELAATGINMLLNNGFEEAFQLFNKHK